MKSLQRFHSLELNREHKPGQEQMTLSHAILVRLLQQEVLNLPLQG